MQFRFYKRNYKVYYKNFMICQRGATWQ